MLTCSNKHFYNRHIDILYFNNPNNNNHKTDINFNFVYQINKTISDMHMSDRKTTRIQDKTYTINTNHFLYL